MYVCSIIDSKIPLFPFYKDLEVAAHIPDSQSAGQIKKTRYRYQSPPNRNLQTTTTTTTSSNLIQPKRHRPNPTQSKKKTTHVQTPQNALPNTTTPPNPHRRNHPRPHPNTNAPPTRHRPQRQHALAAHQSRHVLFRARNHTPPTRRETRNHQRDDHGPEDLRLCP